MTSQCVFCGADITFDGRVLSMTGIPVPTTPGTLEAHDCEQRAKTRAKPCRECNNMIYWWGGKTGPKGNKIPLDLESGLGHVCPVQHEKEKEKPAKRPNDVWDLEKFGAEFRS